MTPVWILVVVGLVLMTPVLLAWLVLIYGVGHFGGGKAILVAGVISAILVILGSFYIEYTCNAAGSHPGQSFEGCGNIVGFHLFIFSYMTLPILTVIVLVSTLIVYRLFSRR